MSLKVTSITARSKPDSDALLASIVDSSYDAIISKDLNSIITSWNRTAERLFGYSAEEAVGQSVLMLIPEDRRSEEDDIIARVRAGERVASFETIRRRKDGTPVAVSLTISPIQDREGVIVGASKIARDITEAKEDERRIRLLMQEVNHRVKNQFAVILAMIRETSRRTVDPQAFEETIRARITALAKSHDMLVGTEWSGANLVELLQKHLEPFAHDEQISLNGPLLTLQSNAVQYLGIAFHELATNSSKYGALSQPEGRIEVSWRLSGFGENRMLSLQWDERFVPRASDRRNPKRKGFGTVVLESIAPQALSGQANIERSAGLFRWTLEAPLHAAIHKGVAESVADEHRESRR